MPKLDAAAIALCENSFKAVEDKNAECLALLTASSPVQQTTHVFMTFRAATCAQVMSEACSCYAAAATMVELTKSLSCSARAEFNKVRRQGMTGCGTSDDCNEG